MSLLLDEQRVKLINKILFAGSQEDVKQVINAAVKLLNQNRLNSEIIDGYFNLIISDLELFSPLKKDAQQWSNIQMARIYFHRLKNILDTPAH